MTEIPVKKFLCSGIVVIRFHNHEYQTVLVKTHKGNYSFPKGKLKQKKGESYLEGAKREMHEETGILFSDLEMKKDGDNYVMIEEYSDKGNPSVIYFVGLYKEKSVKFQFNINELESVEWISVKDALKLENFKQQRKDVLRKAVKFFD